MKKGFAAVVIIIPVVILVFIVIIGVGIFVGKKTHIFGSSAEKAGSELAGGSCSGSGPVTLSVSPMKAEDISSIIPAGLMVFQHVIPIDHQ